MACDAEDACLDLHVFPHLRNPKRSDKGATYYALGPCHNDTERSLSVTWTGSRIIWNCFACSKRLGKDRAQIRTRAALIRAGVPSRCLPRPACDVEAFEDALNRIVFGVESHAHKVLLAAAYLRGFSGELPRGAELRSLAEDCGISLAEAYKVRGLHP
jgi:hypothetical protein